MLLNTKPRESCLNDYIFFLGSIARLQTREINDCPVV